MLLIWLQAGRSGGVTLTHFFPPSPDFTDDDIPSDLSGQVYIITGATAGIGKALAHVLYARNARVYLACRSETKTQAVIEEITSSSSVKNDTGSSGGGSGGSGSVSSSPSGIDCGTDCSEAYAAGTMVTLTATASVGSTFAGWSGGGCTGTDPCTLTITAATSVMAAFDRPPAPGVLSLLEVAQLAHAACGPASELAAELLLSLEQGCAEAAQREDSGRLQAGGQRVHQGHVVAAGRRDQGEGYAHPGAGLDPPGAVGHCPHRRPVRTGETARSVQRTSSTATSPRDC